jgi:DNA repair protein RecO (recombination protein O)
MSIAPPSSRAPRPSRSYSTEGVVIRHHNLGEADRIVTLLTPGHGILRAVARGARKPNSKLGGHLDLVRRVSISATAGRSLDSISQAETLNSFTSLKDDLDLLAQAFYLCELTEKFAAEGAPASGVYQMLVEALPLLASSQQSDLFARWYEMRLLHANGSRPEIQQCVDCGGPLEQENHVFSALRGGIVCPGCRPSGSDRLLPVSVTAVKMLRFLQRSDPGELGRLRLGDADRHQVERVLRDQVHHATDRSVRASQFVDDVRAHRRAGAPR